MHLRRYIQAYREMLNSLQLWNVRAAFDVTWNQLHRKFPLLTASCVQVNAAALGLGGVPGGVQTAGML